MTALEIIDLLKLEPLKDEGGMFISSYSSSELIKTEALPERFGSDHPIGSQIYYLLTNETDSFSAFHTLRSDETWHFYLGDPVELILLSPSGQTETIIMGQDIIQGQKVQVTVPHGVWQGARILQGGEYALLGMSTAPAFKDEDFTLGDRYSLIDVFPEMRKKIETLTRG
ncbi:MAG: cupin domain-containing protein [Spirochaetales bacterium]|nr:cupin domain-containing protein [Spirochaetales bacterium]